MIPIFLPLSPELDDPSDEPPCEEADAEPPAAEEPFEDPPEDPDELLISTIVDELEKLMLGVSVVELEPYTYEVVPEDGESAHTMETDWIKAWKCPPAAV